MADRGRPRKPVEQLKRQGTYRKDRHGSTSLAVVASAEPALTDLDTAAVLERVLSDGVAWLGQTDTIALAMLRETLQERTEVRERALAGSSEARRELRDLDRQAMSLLGRLGFDPASRAQLGLAEVKAASKLEELRRGRKG